MAELSELLARHGVALVFANVLLAQAGVPLPAVPLLAVAGAFVAQGEIGLVALLFAAVAASLMGDVPWFFAGRRYGYRILGTLCRVAIEPDACVKQTENIFARFGARSLVAAKFVPGFATVAPPLAGATRLPFPRFVLYSAAGALAWAALPVAAGAYFHAEIEWLLGRLEAMGAGALALVGGALAAYLAAKAAERYLLLRHAHGAYRRGRAAPAAPGRGEAGDSRCAFGACAQSGPAPHTGRFCHRPGCAREVS